MSRSSPQILAHRGAVGVSPENSLPALTSALRSPFWAAGVELDVRFTSDDQVVVFHDDQTDRLTGVPGSIESRSAEEVASLRVAGEIVPTLAQVIEALSVLATRRAQGTPSERTTLNVEVKLSPDPARAVALLRPLLDPLVQGSPLDLVVSSFDPRVLAQARSQGAPWRLALLYETLDALSALPALEGPTPLDLHPHEALVTALHIQDLKLGPHRALRVWTVDDPIRAQALSHMGVDALITNHPERLRSALWRC